MNDDFILFAQYDGGDVRLPVSGVGDGAQFIIHDGELISGDDVAGLFPDGGGVIVAVNDGVRIDWRFIIFGDVLLLFTLFLFII